MAVDISGLSAVADPLGGLNIAQITQLLNSAFGGKTQGASNTNTLSSGTTSKESPVALAFLQQLIPGLQGQVFNQDFSKQAAIQDSMGGVNQILRTLKEQALPGVFAAEAASGGYNSTVKTQLTNDLTARAAAQGSALIADTATKYAAADSARTRNLIDSIKAAVDAQQIGNSQSMSNAATVSDNTNKGLLQNPLLLGTFGALSALGVAPDIISKLASTLGFTGIKMLPDGGIDWGSFTGSGEQGGFIGDTSDISQGFPTEFGAPGDPEDYSWLMEDIPGSIEEIPGDWFTAGG